MRSLALYPKKKNKCLILVAAFVFLFLFLLFPLSAFAESGESGDTGADGSEEVSAEEELWQNIEGLLNDLDVDALQAYLDSLSEEQKDLIGGDLKDKMLSLISGDFKADYGNVFEAIAASVFDGLDGLLSTFCVIAAITVLCGILSQFKSSFSEKSTAKLIFFVGYAAVLVLILSSLSVVIEDCYNTVGSM